MRDLNLSRVITVVAAGSLLISATGCKKKEKEDDDGPAPEKEEALLSLCDALQECAPEEFYAEYDDVDDCLYESSQSYDATIDEFGDDCGEAFLRFSNCFGNAWSASCDEYAVYEDCLGEILRMNADCTI